MPAPGTRIAHLVASDVPAARLGVLAALVSQPAEPKHRTDIVQHLVVQVGRGKLPPGAPMPSGRARAAFDVPWLGGRSLRTTIEGLNEAADGAVLLLHVWSAQALSWCLPWAGPGRPLLVETDLLTELRPIVRWFRSRSTGATITFACPTALAQRRLTESGVPLDACALIRECVDFATLNAAHQAVLGQARDDCVRLAFLPPIRRSTGAFIATWAALLVRQMRPDVRIIVPDEHAEVRRLERLVRSCRMTDAARFVGQELSVAELIAAADLIAYLPDGDAPITGLAWAMAAGKPIVASAVPAVTELLTHGQNAWLCRANSPKHAARRILQVLEQPQKARMYAELARTQAFKVFGRQRMIEQYARVYANLQSGQPAGAGCPM